MGTAFAFCDESGVETGLKSRVLDSVRHGTLDVFTDPLASPTGFPFKVARLEGTLGDDATYGDRQRICDLGYLRRPFRKGPEELGYRCPGEPEDHFIRKGGHGEETEGRKCICNGLMATIGLGQIQSDGTPEPPLITTGDDVAGLTRFLHNGANHYSAADVVHHLLGQAS